MAQLTVTKISGEVFATSRDGVLRTLKLGDIIKEGELIVTKNGSMVSLIDDTGTPINIPENQTFLSSPEIFTSDVPLAQDAAVVSGTTNAVVEALNRGEDLSTELEATAAGLGGGFGADGGSSFVQLLRIVEGVDPLSYEYSFNAQDLPPDLEGLAGQLVVEEVVLVPPVILELPVVITTESETRVSTSITTEINAHPEIETGRTLTTTVTEELNDNETASIKTTITTTTIVYNRATDTVTTTVTTTETWVREVTTTTYPNGDVTVVKGDWALNDTVSDADTDTETTNTPRTEVVPDVVVIEIPIDPNIVVATETKTEVVTDVKTETNVKGEVETGRTSTTEEVIILNDDETVSIKTITVTTTITYDQATDTVTTTTVTTNTYSRDITTTTTGVLVPVVVTGEWVLTNTDADITPTTDTIVTPRIEVISEVTVIETPVAPVVVVTTETKTEVVTDVKTETNIKGEIETDRTSTTTVTEELNEDKTATIKTTTVVTTITYNQDTDTITTTTTTTNSYSRDITTTTHGTNDPVVVTGEWVLTDSNSVENQETSTESTPRTEVVTDVDTTTTPVEPPEDNDNGNNGHGNNTDGQDDDNPGQGSGGPNSDPKDGDDEDEGEIGNQGDNTPGVGQNDVPQDPIPPLLPPEEEDDLTPVDSNPKEHEDNGKGNGIDPAPGGSGDTPGNDADGSNDTIPPLLPLEDDDTPGNSGQNNGHGNNTDGQDDDNPGKGSGGPNIEHKDLLDEDEGLIGNHGDTTPGSPQSISIEDNLSWNLLSSNLYTLTKSESDF